MIRYLSGIVTSALKVDTDGFGCHSGWDPYGFCSGYGGCAGVFPVIFVLYSNDLPCKYLSLAQ